MIHWVLVSEIKRTDLANVGIGMLDGCVEVAVRRHVAGIESLGFKSVVINGSFQDSIVVIVPVIDVKNAVVVMVVRVGPVATVKAFKQVKDAVVVVVKVVEVVDPIVVVVTCLCFL